MGGKSGGKPSSPAGLFSSAIATELYNMTRPGRHQYLKAWGDIKRGEMPFGDTAFPAMMQAARGPIEQQYDVARGNILETIPEGGRLEEALTGVETARAQGLQGVVADYLMDQLNKMYGVAWGQPQIAMSGLQGPAYIQGQFAGQQQAAQLGAAEKMRSLFQPDPQNVCCFNFLEAEGEIHSAVRRYRDEHFSKTGLVAKGYRKSAQLFVPLMQKYQAFKNLIRLTMTRPLKAYAQWYYKENQYGFIFRPIAEGWVNCWRLLGIRSN